MTPTSFPEVNKIFRPPNDLAESQCGAIPAHVGIIQGGSMDGSIQVVVAWKPSAEEIDAIIEGKPVFLSVIGGLPPHFLTTNFHAATHPA